MPNWFIAWPARFELSLPPAPRGLRVLHPDDRHVTLAFLGDVDEPRALTAWALRAGLPRTLSGTLARVEALGASASPALTAIVEGLAGLDALEDARDLLRLQAGVEPEGRPLLPHVTLARVQRQAQDREREAALAWSREIRLADRPVHLGPLSLYTWAADRRDRLFRVVRCDDDGDFGEGDAQR